MVVLALSIVNKGGRVLVVVLLYPRVRRILRLFKEKSFNASVDDLLVPSSAC